MADSRTELLVEIVGEATRRPPGEREAYVRSACPDAESLREAMSLVAALDRAGPFLDRAAAGPAGAEVLRERPGTMVGRYKLLQQIGEGGFGVVFSAEQLEPVHRVVALKIIKLGMDTAAVVSRFEAERQTLALMDHPCIAKVLDGGATETGRPYFVMELVKGEPITRYCDLHGLTPAHRLDLFVQVCRAVQHAHSKGVIHRDLKPGNVLVTEVDGKPVPRVIDFGIAKATAAGEAGKAAFTEARQFVGTPEYMSPEQSPGVDIDTRTDVYSLGVLLYELLTGVTPLDPARLRSAAWDQMLRIIREENPPRPSTRITTHGPSRHGGAGERAAYLRGDLDWIVMRCLEKDRARRYQTADGLATDIERHMKGEAVLAAPPSRTYRMRKFVTRHRTAVAAAGVVVAALLAGLSAAVWQANIAAKERDAAEASRKETEQIATFQAAQLRGIDPQDMGRRLREDLLAADAAAAPFRQGESPLAPMLARLNLTNVALRTLDRTIFSRALAAIDQQFADQPALRAGILLTVSETMADLGLLDPAEAPMTAALDIRRARYGDDDPRTMQAAGALGALLLRRGKLAEAETLLESTLDRSRRLTGSDDPIAIDTLRNMGMLRASQDRVIESEKLLREALDRSVRTFGPGDRRTLWTELNLGVTLLATGGPAQAEPHFRRAYDGMLALVGPDHRDTIKCLNNLANCLRLQHRYTEAEPLLRESLATLRRVAGDRHRDTLGALHTFGQLLLSRKGPGDLEQADSIFEQLVESRRSALGPDHGDTIAALYILGDIRSARGHYAQAEPPLREVIDRLTAMGSAMGPQAIMARLELGRTLASLGRYAEAETQLLEAVRVLQSSGHGGGRANTGPGPGVQDLADLYTAWDHAEPGKGYAEKASQWQPRADPGKAPSNR